MEYRLLQHHTVEQVLADIFESAEWNTGRDSMAAVAVAFNLRPEFFVTP